MTIAYRKGECLLQMYLYHFRLTYDDNVELRIELFDFDGNFAYAEYKTFRIDTEQFNFNLMVSDYQGNASDAMSYHHDQDFSTYDHSNDKSSGSFPCALTYGSGWWFNRYGTTSIICNNYQ